MSEKHNNRFSAILVIIVMSGIAIAVYSFLYNRSLWLDEAMLALNIARKSYWELLRPLDLGQVAPIGFLFIEKTFVILFDNYDWALRIYPFISYALSIPIFYNVARILTKSKQMAAFSTALFSINYYLILYSTELKQYSSDVYICLIIILSALLYHHNNTKFSSYVYLFVGLLAVWFSNVAVIMLATVAIFSLYKSYLVRKEKQLIFFIAVWIISFTLYYSLFIYGHPTKDLMVNFWQNSFMPQNILSMEFIRFIFNSTKMTFGKLLGFQSLSMVFAIIAFIGSISLIVRKQFDILFLLLAPVLLHLSISSFKLYPFFIRFILYLVPLLIILITIGLFFIWEYISRISVKIPIYLLLLPFIYLYIPLLSNLPIEKEEIKECLQYISHHIKSNEKIYVYPSAFSAFLYYQEFYPKIMDAEIIYGDRELNTMASKFKGFENKFNDILYEKGTIWLLFSHVHKLDSNGDEKNYLLRKLEEQNFIILESEDFTGSSVYKVKKELVQLK